MEHDNKRFICYNANLQLYDNLEALIQDVPRIAGMNFNTVWLNPFFEACAGFPPELAAQGPDSTIGSPYAQRTMDIARRFSNHSHLPPEARRSLDYMDVRRLTDTMRQHGLSPMADLVLHHVAIDNPIVNSKATRLQTTRDTAGGLIPETRTIDTSRWFRRHAETGALALRARDAHYVKTRKEAKSWDDIAIFNYEDPVIRKEIEDYYFKPLIDTMVKQMGFEGFRFDAAGMIPTEVYASLVPHMDRICHEAHGKPTRNIAEVTGDCFHEHIRVGRNSGYTPGFADYCYNDVFFAATDHFHFHANHPGEMFECDDGWTSKNRSWFDQLVRGGTQIEYFDPARIAVCNGIVSEYLHPNGRGVGCISGSIGNHDEQRYVQTLIDNGVTEGKNILRSLKRKMAIGAFYSTAGHFVQRGDEFGVIPQANVFTAQPGDLEHKVEGIDLTSFILDVNRTLRRLPNPQQTDVNWGQAVRLEDKPDIVGVIAHHGQDYTGRCDLILTNISVRPHEIDIPIVERMMREGARNALGQRSIMPDAVHLVGGLMPSIGLKTLEKNSGLALGYAAKTMDAIVTFVRLGISDCLISRV